jgi:uncharacterized protein YgiM (DUF1202 family)
MTLNSAGSYTVTVQNGSGTTASNVQPLTIGSGTPSTTGQAALAAGERHVAGLTLTMTDQFSSFADFRTGPGLTFPNNSASTIPNGADVVLASDDPPTLNTSDGYYWSQVTYSGVTGWAISSVFSLDRNLTKTYVTGTIVVADTSVNLRSSPNTNNTPIGPIPAGTRLSIIAHSVAAITDANGTYWYRVNHNGTEGWVAGTNLSLVSDGRYFILKSNPRADDRSLIAPLAQMTGNWCGPASGQVALTYWRPEFTHTPLANSTLCPSTLSSKELQLCQQQCRIKATVDGTTACADTGTYGMKARLTNPYGLQPIDFDASPSFANVFSIVAKARHPIYGFFRFYTDPSCGTAGSDHWMVVTGVDMGPDLVLNTSDDRILINDSWGAARQTWYNFNNLGPTTCTSYSSGHATPLVRGLRRIQFSELSDRLHGGAFDANGGDGMLYKGAFRPVGTYNGWVNETTGTANAQYVPYGARTGMYSIKFPVGSTGRVYFARPYNWGNAADVEHTFSGDVKGTSGRLVVKVNGTGWGTYYSGFAGTGWTKLSVTFTPGTAPASGSWVEVGCEQTSSAGETFCDDFALTRFDPTW